MGLNAALEVDLRSISAEARRRFPAIKDAAEHAVLKLRSLPDAAAIAKSDELLKVSLAASDSKGNLRLAALGLSCLQKLVANDAVRSDALPQILAALQENAEAPDEMVQLKVLQALLTVLQSQLHPTDEESMGKLLGTCLRLLGSPKHSDCVSSTASATFRQAVALTFDRVVESENLQGSFSALRQRSVGRAGRQSELTDVSRLVAVSSGRDEEDLEMVRVLSAGRRIEAANEMSPAGRLGLHLFEDLLSLASGNSAPWLQVPHLSRSFALEIIEYVVSQYVVLFRMLRPFEQAIAERLCSLLMTSIRANSALEEGETSEPAFRRMVLRSIASLMRLYSETLVTECEVLLTMLIKSLDFDLPQWHRILVLEVLRGFCVEARTLKLIFKTFDLSSSNSNIVADVVAALAQVVVAAIKKEEASEESLAAVAGMFSSKAKGIEWTMDFDWSGNAVVVASEAHAISLAVEGLLGVVFTIAMYTDEAIDRGEVASPRHDFPAASSSRSFSGESSRLSVDFNRASDEASSSSVCEAEKGEVVERGELVEICEKMVDAVWQTLLDALSLMLARSSGEAVVLEILKGYQAFTQACGVLSKVTARDEFLASLCKFTLVASSDSQQGGSTAAAADGSGTGHEPRDGTASLATSSSSTPASAMVLTSKNLQSLRTLFNISHRLCSVLGPSWQLVMETLAALDRTIHAPHATVEDGASGLSGAMQRGPRESGGSSSSSSSGGGGVGGGVQSSDFSILSSLDAQLFESTAHMGEPAVASLLAALQAVSKRALKGVTVGLGVAASGSAVQKNAAAATVGGSLPGQIGGQGGLKMFAVERMLKILEANLFRADLFWDLVMAHLLELGCHESSQVRAVAIDALDRAVLSALSSNRVREEAEDLRDGGAPWSISLQEGAAVAAAAASVGSSFQLRLRAENEISGQAETSPRGSNETFECIALAPVQALFDRGQDVESQSGAMKILLHVLERHGERLHHSWPNILLLLRVVAATNNADLIPIGFQSVQVLLNDCLPSVPPSSLETCVEVAGAYAEQTAEMNIALTAISLLWTTADFFARGIADDPFWRTPSETRLGSHGDLPSAASSTLLSSSPSPSLSASPSLAAATSTPPLPGLHSHLSANRNPPFSASTAGDNPRRTLSVGARTPGVAVRIFGRSDRDRGGSDGYDSPLLEGAKAAGDGGGEEGGIISSQMKMKPKLDERSEQLLLGVFSAIKMLTADDRPEVRNAAIRTLFQSLVGHGSKLSSATWQHAVFKLVFPMIHTVRKLASTASSEVSEGTELGRQGGRAVRMLVHHSRNTEQKQWDETLVLALSGISRLLRSFFPRLQETPEFENGWQEILHFIEESVLTGSKEVSSAAISALQVVLLSHATKGNVRREFWCSAFASYEVAVRGSVSEESSVPSKTKQQMVQDLADIYSGGRASFTSLDYLKMLALVDLMARKPLAAGEAAPMGSLPMVQRSVIESLPRMQPSDAISVVGSLASAPSAGSSNPKQPVNFKSNHPSQEIHLLLWSSFLRQLLSYLPGGEKFRSDHCRVPLKFERRAGGGEKVTKMEEDAEEEQKGVQQQYQQQQQQQQQQQVEKREESTAALREGSADDGNERGAAAAAEGGGGGGGEAADEEQETLRSREGDGGMAVQGDEKTGKESRKKESFSYSGLLKNWSSHLMVMALGEEDEEEEEQEEEEATNGRTDGSSERDSRKARDNATQVELRLEPMGGFPETSAGALSHLFAERIVAMLFEMLSAAPGEVRLAMRADFIAALGRCLMSRRDHPESPLWRTAVAVLKSFLDSSLPTDAELKEFDPLHTTGGYQSHVGSSREDEGRKEQLRQAPAAAAASKLSSSFELLSPQTPQQTRAWHQIADVFEVFLMGACGRAVLRAAGAEGAGGEDKVKEVDSSLEDEGLENEMLQALSDVVLLRCLEAPREVRQRLVAVIDQCAARTGSLSLSSTASLPPHCVRFSLACLHRLFLLAGRGGQDVDEESSEVIAARIALPLLIQRCDKIMSQFLHDSAAGESHPIPSSRTSELILLLQELNRLKLSPAVAAAVDVPIGPKEERQPQAAADSGSSNSSRGAPPTTSVLAASDSQPRMRDSEGRQLGWQRAHLLLLFTPICELAFLRDRQVTELAVASLRIVGDELGLTRSGSLQLDFCMK